MVQISTNYQKAARRNFIVQRFAALAGRERVRVARQVADAEKIELFRPVARLSVSGQEGTPLLNQAEKRRVALEVDMARWVAGRAGMGWLTLVKV